MRARALPVDARLSRLADEAESRALIAADPSAIDWKLSRVRCHVNLADIGTRSEGDSGSRLVWAGHLSTSPPFLQLRC